MIKLLINYDSFWYFRIKGMDYKMYMIIKVTDSHHPYRTIFVQSFVALEIPSAYHTVNIDGTSNFVQGYIWSLVKSTT